MRRLLVFMLMMTPWVAQAASVDKNIWHACQADSDCIVVAGACVPTAVNAAYKAEAVKHYAELAAVAKCAKQFWAPKAKIARCHLNACETVVN